MEQVHLRCTEGSLEWMYPARALRVVLEPNLSSARHTTVCIKPASDFQGASIYVERAGQLHLVVGEAEGARPHHVSCFSAHTPQRVALFLQASPQRDISRRTASFQYELLSNQSAAGPDFKKMALVEGKSWASLRAPLLGQIQGGIRYPLTLPVRPYWQKLFWAEGFVIAREVLLPAH